MRFAVRRPGSPEASPRSHGVPRRDVPGRVHVSVAGVAAGHAAKQGLALAAARCDVPARRAALARVRGTYFLDPAGCLVLQAADQQAPSGSQDAPVQPGLGPDIAARFGQGASRGPGHVLDLKILDANHVEAPGDVGAGLLGAVLAPVDLAGLQPGDGRAGASSRCGTAGKVT